MEDTEFIFKADTGNCECRFGRVENRGGDICDCATELWFMGVTGVAAAVAELLDNLMCPASSASVCGCRDVSVNDEPAE